MLVYGLLMLTATALMTWSTSEAIDIHANPTYRTYCSSIQSEEQLPQTCLDLGCHGYSKSGVYTIYPTGRPHYSFDVYCDQETDGGGWMVFQRRMDGSVDFYRNWQNYKMGFGKVDGEHWLGNDKLAEIISLHTNNELRVDLESVENEKAYANYSTFHVGDESAFYRLTVTGYSGTAGDSLSPQSGGQFTTRDSDHDSWGSNCAVSYQGAWWYKSCHQSNLNGLYLQGSHTSFANGVNWKLFKGYNESLKTTEMKFRPRV